MATTTDISTLKINYLTQAQYDAALANNQINANELYLTPAAPVGSVTSIDISNATNGGLTISGGPVTTSGTITIGHSNVLSSAQTIQAIYPIKIDKNGHISAYGTAVTPLTASSTLDATKLSGTIPASCYTDTNTTYTFADGTNSFTVTPSGGTAQTVTVTPSLTAADVGAVPTSRTVNGKALSANVADADYITSQGTSSSWRYRKWNSGIVEAWREYDFAAATPTTWASPVRYWDKTINIPSGLFNSIPVIIATAKSTQYWVVGGTCATTTSGTIRLGTVSSSNIATTISILLIGT